MSISSLPYRTSVLRVSQPIGEYWVGIVPASVLLEVTIPDRLRLAVDPKFQEANSDEWREALRVIGTQRTLEQRRLREIGAYIDTRDSTFPNAIILAANSEEHGDDTDEFSGAPWELNRKKGELTIPQSAAKARVVDGQHRLYGFLFSESKREDFGLLCAVFFGLPAPLQALLFATINTNQKPVRRGMALNLYGYNIDDEERDVWHPEKLAVFVARRLHWDEDSRLYNRIKLEADGAEPPELLPGATRAVPLAAVVDGVLGLISRKPKDDRTVLRSKRFLRSRKRADLADDGASLRGWYRASADAELYELVRTFVNVVDDVLWDRGAERSMLTRAVGVRALFQFFDRLLRQLELPVGRDGKPREKIVRQVHDGVHDAMNEARRVDFGDSFFEANAVGQRRILDVLGLVSRVFAEEDVPPDTLAQSRLLIRSR